MVLRSPRTRSCVAVEEEEERTFRELWLEEWRLWRVSGSGRCSQGKNSDCLPELRSRDICCVFICFSFFFCSAKAHEPLFALCPHSLRKHCCNDTPFRSFVPAPLISPSLFFAYLKHFAVLRHGSTPLPFRGLYSVGHQCIGLCTQHNQASDGMWAGQWRH